MQDIFLYVRTKLAVEFEDDSLDKLHRHLPYEWITIPGIEKNYFTDAKPILVAEFLGKEAPWQDGLVFRFKSWASVDQLADRIRPFLNGVEAWAIFGLDGSHAEENSLSPIARFFEKQGKRPFHQIFLVEKYAGKVFGEATNRIEELTDGLPVFHFRNGKIILFDPAWRPNRTILERELQKLKHWAMVDRYGDARPQSLWQSRYLRQLDYYRHLDAG